jgi:hypothetical protein
VSRPCYGKCEGFIIVKIEKGTKATTLMSSYNEFERDDFSVDRKKFLTGVMNEYSRAVDHKPPQDGMNFVLIGTDANVRLGKIQEGDDNVDYRWGIYAPWQNRKIPCKPHERKICIVCPWSDIPFQIHLPR